MAARHEHRIPIEWADNKALKATGLTREAYVRPYCRRMERRNRYGAYFIFKSLDQGPKFQVSAPKAPTHDPDYRIIRRTRGRYTHYYFYIRDEVLGPLIVCVGSFLPFQTTYILNGHHFIERELQRAGVAFRKDDNALLWVADGRALQSGCRSAQRPDQRLDYWTWVVGPKFSPRTATPSTSAATARSSRWSRWSIVAT